MIESNKYDLIIIGAGPGGYVSAIRAGQSGMKVCVVERGEVGGVCLNLGCIPTKAGLKEAENIRGAQRYFENVKIPPEEMWQKIVSASMKPLNDLRKGIENLFKLHNVELIRGEAILDEENSVIVRTEKDKARLLADNIIIATGSRPAIIKGFEPDHKRIITSDDVFKLKIPPKRLAIIGGGAIGCEFATLFHGAVEEINIIEIMPHLLPFLDESVSQVVEREFRKNRINIYTGMGVRECRLNENVTLILNNGKSIEVDMVLLAGGRRANTECLSRSSVTVNENGKVKVDSQMRTNVPGIYAIGDCAGPMMLAHTASEEGIIAVETISGKERRMDYSAIPVTVFSSPEVASAGMTEKKAKEKGIACRVSDILYRSLGRPHADNAIAGMVRIVTDDEGRIIGSEIAGKNATEVIHVIALAIKQGLKYTELKDMVFAHPTYSELIRETVDLLDGLAIHSRSK